MKNLIKAMDNLPWIVKLILAFPILDGLVWGVYRLLKGLVNNNLLQIIGGIIWIFVGAAILWIIDIISIIFRKKVVILA